MNPALFGENAEITWVTQKQVSGPTQTASETLTTSRWESHPFFARFIRLAIFLLPLAIAVIFSIWASRRFPPEAVGLDDQRLVWWLGLAILSTVLVRVIERITAKLTPLSLLFRLSLIFPDQAPSRFSAALKTGSPRSLQRKLTEIQETGQAFTPDETYSEQMLELVAVLATHDRMTRGHAERVRAYSELIGEEMGLSTDELGKLRWSALLHDMGKLHVPGEILNKAGRPDEDEWAILKEHPAKAEEYLEPLAEWLGEWRHAAVGHHERWDGNGYPQGQAGTQIPLSARIVAVADAYDVMTSTRSYKKAMPAELARQEVADKAGSQFDPEVSRAFLAIGLGDLRRTAGPLAFLSNLPLIRNIPIGQTLTGAATTTATSVSTAVTAAVAATTAAVAGAPVDLTPPPPPAVAFAEPSTLEVAAADLSGFEDELLSGSIVLTGDGPFTLTVIEQPERGTLDIDPDAQIDQGTVLGVSYSPEANQFGMYEFWVEACDANGVCVEQAIAISVAPVNDPPVAAPDRFTAREGEVLFIDIASLVSNDTDAEGSPLTIRSFTSPENGLLLQSSDSLIFTPDPGFAGDTTFTYTTSDGETESEPTTVTVSVEAGANRQPSLSFNSTLLPENSPAGTPAGAAVGTDPDGETVSYAIAGGNGAQLFTIDSLTGALETTAPIDFESSPVLTLVVTVTDASGQTSSATTTISIADQNEPPLLGTSGPLSVSENAPAGALVTNGLIVGSDPDGDTLTFTLTDPNGFFSIDPSSGQIKRGAAPLNFESASEHEVTVTATDPDGASSDTATFIIGVTDVDEPPVIQPGQIFTIDEEQPAATAVSGVVVFDDPEGDPVIWSANDPNFAIDPTTGQIRSLLPLDFDTGATTFEVDVTAAAAAGSSTESVTINVQPVDERPTFTATNPASIIVPELSIVGAPVATLGVNNPESEPLTFSIDGGDGVGQFDIDASSGAIELIGAIDFETGPNIYALDVRVADTDDPALFDTLRIDLIVRNDPEPATLDRTVPFSISENVPPNSVVQDNPIIINPDGGPPPRFELMDASGQFAINPASGDMTLVAGTLDFETQPYYEITLKLIDDTAAVPLIDSWVTRIDVIDENDAPMLITPTTLDIDPTIAVGTLVRTVMATDVDEGDTLTFQPLTGDGALFFEIDPTSGEIRTTALFNPAIQPGPFSLRTVVFDSKNLSDFEDITVTLDPSNIAPDINSLPTFAVVDSAMPGTEVGTLAAFDPDGDNIVAWEIVGGTGEPFFDISPTGRVSLASTINFDDASSYTLEVEATDDGAPAPETSPAVTITINVTSQFGTAPSPFFGGLIFNEVRFSAGQTANDGIDRVEILNLSPGVIDLRGWTLRDSPLGETDPNSFSITSPIFQTAMPGRALISVIDANGASDPDALQDNDDLFLFDPSGNLVAYMAWGSPNAIGSEIGIRPPINTWGLWDPTYEAGLTFFGGDSLSLTPDGQNSTASGCWERTGTGAAANCPGAPPTLNTSPFANFGYSWNAPNTN